MPKLNYHSSVEPGLRKLGYVGEFSQHREVFHRNQWHGRPARDFTRKMRVPHPSS